MTDALDLAALRKMAEEAVRKGRVGYPGVPISPEFLLSLLDQIDEWEATDKANADERRHLLDRIQEHEGLVKELRETVGRYQPQDDHICPDTIEELLKKYGALTPSPPPSKETHG